MDRGAEAGQLGGHPSRLTALLVVVSPIRGETTQNETDGAGVLDRSRRKPDFEGVYLSSNDAHLAVRAGALVALEQQTRDLFSRTQAWMASELGSRWGEEAAAARVELERLLDAGHLDGLVSAPAQVLADRLHAASLEWALGGWLGPDDPRGQDAERRARRAVANDARALIRALDQLTADVRADLGGT